MFIIAYIFISKHTTVMQPIVGLLPTQFRQKTDEAFEDGDYIQACQSYFSSVENLDILYLWNGSVLTFNS